MVERMVEDGEGVDWGVGAEGGEALGAPVLGALVGDPGVTVGCVVGDTVGAALGGGHTQLHDLEAQPPAALHVVFGAPWSPRVSNKWSDGRAREYLPAAGGSAQSADVAQDDDLAVTGGIPGHGSRRRECCGWRRRGTHAVTS